MTPPECGLMRRVDEGKKIPGPFPVVSGASPLYHDMLVMDTFPDMVTQGLPPRPEILALLHEHTETPGLRKHALAVEIAMRAYASRFGEDPELWGATGLIHDFD